MIRTTLAGLYLATAGLTCSFAAHAAAQTNPAAVPILSRHALVIDESSGQRLVEKNAKSVVPIASLTKLMTAMVVLDAKQDMTEELSIEHADVDLLKHSSSRVPVGATLPRRTLLHLTLMSSENRAASSLARSYPGGMPAFRAAVREKARELGLSNTVIKEPTGLSPHNISTASDLAKMAKAASAYPEIAHLSTRAAADVDINGRTLAYRNSNSFVGKSGWDILLSKTGYTKEAGRCIVMRLEEAGRSALVVLLNANGPQARAADISNIRRLLAHRGGEGMLPQGFVKVKASSKVSGKKSVVKKKPKKRNKLTKQVRKGLRRA